MSLRSWTKPGYSVCIPQYTAVCKVLQFLGRRLIILTKADNRRRARHSYHSSKSTEDGSSTRLSKVGTYLHNYTASRTRCLYTHASQNLTSKGNVIRENSRYSGWTTRWTTEHPRIDSRAQAIHYSPRRIERSELPGALLHG